MIRSFLAGALFISLSSASAFADRPALHATLVSPTNERSFVAGDVAWRCDGSSCETASAQMDKGPRALCRELVRRVGLLSAFETFDAAQLQACNAARRQ